MTHQKTEAAISIRLLTTPAAEMMQILGIAHRRGHPLFMWTFDEAANLSDEYFAVLRRTMLAFASQTIWTLFLSTNSMIGRFIGPVQQDPSSRVRQRLLKRFRPFYAFPIDVEATRCLESLDGYRKRPMIEFTTVNHMSAFGRPLWNAYSTEDPMAVQQFVQPKLLCGSSLAVKGPLTLWTQQVFALISARVSLHAVKSSVEAIELDENAVNKHLRVMVGWGEDPRVIHSTTISEPLVSDAAATLLMAKPQGAFVWRNALETLGGQLLSRGLISKGTKGELFARIILILAADFTREPAMNQNQTDAGGSHPVFAFSIPIPVSKFLGTLFGDERISRLNEPQPRRRRLREATPVQSKYDACEEGFVNFNHFTHTLEPLPMDPTRNQELLYMLLRKQEALQLCTNQEFWDLLIPVYLGSLTQEFDVCQTTAIVIQVKNKINKTNLLPSQKQFDQFFHSQHPILHILLDLGVGSDFKSGRLLQGQAFYIIARGNSADTFQFLDRTGLGSACKLLAEMEAQEAPSVCQQIVDSLMGVKIPTEGDIH